MIELPIVITSRNTIERAQPNYLDILVESNFGITRLPSEDDDSLRHRIAKILGFK